MAKKLRKTGPARMKELGKLKVEVWFTKDQLDALCELANRAGLPVATLTRRLCIFCVRTGLPNDVRGLTRIYD